VEPAAHVGTEAPAIDVVGVETVSFADAGHTFVASVDHGNGRPRTALVTGTAEDGTVTEAEWAYRPKLGGKGFRLSEPDEGRTFEFDAGKALVRVTGSARQTVPELPPPSAGADEISRAHLSAIRADPDMFEFMDSVVAGSFTGKKGYGGHIRPELSAARRDGLFEATATFKQYAANLRDAIGVDGSITLYRAVKVDPSARAAARFDEILPSSTSYSLDAVTDWIHANAGNADEYAVFKIAVPQGHTKVALSYPAQHTATQGEPRPLNQGQLEVVLSPTRLELKASATVDGVEVLEVEAHELDLSEVRALISYSGPVMSLDDAYGRIKGFYNAESVKAAYPEALGDASVSVHDVQDGSSRTLTAVKPGSETRLTVTVSRDVAADAVSVVYDVGGTEPVRRTIRAGDVNPLVDALVGGTLATTEPFRELPVPSDWSEVPGRVTPVPPGRRLSIAPVVRDIPINLDELARSAGLTARLDEIRAAAIAPSAEVFDQLAADLGGALTEQLSTGRLGQAGHTRAVIDVSADSPNSLRLAQAVVNRTGRQVGLHASGVLIAELCPPLER
ncbi:MAG TPA: hypothetical protein VGG23_03605, partial [Acidimicrobiales bacterium]